MRDRTKELKTRSSRDSGADHGCGWWRRKQNSEESFCQGGKYTTVLEQEVISHDASAEGSGDDAHLEAQWHDAEHSHHEQHA